MSPLPERSRCLSAVPIATNEHVEPRTDPAPPRRIIDPGRHLPGGRAVLGGVLVALAAAGLFLAARPTSAVPDTRFVVARHPISPGHRLTAADLRLVALDLPSQVAAGTAKQVEPLVGRLAVARIPAGALVDESYVAHGTTTKPLPLLSFAIDIDRAVGGDLVAGDQIDLLATWEGDPDHRTEIVAHDLTLTAVDQPDPDALGGDARLVLSVAVPTSTDAVELTRAIRSAELTIIRTTGTSTVP